MSLSDDNNQQNEVFLNDDLKMEIEYNYLKNKYQNEMDTLHEKLFDKKEELESVYEFLESLKDEINHGEKIENIFNSISDFLGFNGR